ncbi:hypothetical protein [Candidatus Methylobacter oryzae]|uniref:hypothetical protein n=1 Tax=Candidatus Methylobacter oryzae TaxID=2497749 RepID=UPI0018AD3653|nr:hypothetical protein [Candidatus Methylobacter oryzae]
MTTSSNNPWGIRFMTMFHMSNDSHLFHDCSAPDRLPLYEAKMIHQFDHRWATYCVGGKDTAGDVALADKQNPDFCVTPRYWVDKVEVEQRLRDKGWDRGWLLGFRDICRATDERTVIASVLPKLGVGHTMPLFTVNSITRKTAALLGNLDSIVLDFIARQKLGGTHLTYSYLKQFPILPPDFYSEPDLDFIVPRVLELTYTAHDLQPWAQDLGYDGTPFTFFDPFAPDRRAILRAELDAWYARAYGLNGDELSYILDPADVMGDDYPSETFRVLKNNELKAFNEYRTANLILREFDRMALADEAKEPYVSRLVPPPGRKASPAYSPLGVIRDENDARLAGLILTVLREAGTLSRQLLTLLSQIIAQNDSAYTTSTPDEAILFNTYRRENNGVFESERIARLQLLLRFFEESGVIRIEQQGARISAMSTATIPAGLIIEKNMAVIANILLRAAQERLQRLSSSDVDNEFQSSTKQA